jgi:SAM-dependent methyltransferase
MKHRWNERYAEEAALYGEAPNAFLVSVAERFPVGGRLLGLAEGQGRNARFLAGRGHPVVAVDSADVAVEQLAARSEREGAAIEAVEADLGDYQPPPCAGVFAIYAHLPPAVRERAYRRAWEALEPGGVFVLEAFTPDQLGRGTGGPPMRELLFGAEELRALLPEARFELLEEREVELDEGPLHRGLAAVVRMVAVKD